MRKYHVQFCRRARVATLPLSLTALRTQKAPAGRHDGTAAQSGGPQAKLQDREGVPLLLEPIKGDFPRMEKVWVDNGYTGTGASGSKSTWGGRWR